MAILGRNSGQTDLLILIGSVINKDITSSDVGLVVYYDIPSDEFQILTSIDPSIITQNVVGIIRAVTTDGDGVNQGVANVVTKGSVPYAGANPGQVMFLETDGSLRVGPPTSPAVAVRMGSCARAGNVNIEIDVTAMQIETLRTDMQAQLDTLQTTIEEIQSIVDPERVDNYGIDDIGGVNPSVVDTNYGADDIGGEDPGVLFNSNYGADDVGGTLVA